MPDRSRYRLADKEVWRVGYGAMQLAGDGVFGPPRDRDEAIAVLRAAVDAGVDHIDTAQYYGPGVVNELIREALHPYPDGLALVSKVAARRDESGAVLPYDDPDQLRAGIEDNLATLGVEQLTAVNLRVMDNAAPDARFVDQLGALTTAQDEGLIAGIGISNITRDHLMRALEVTEIVCVQNFFNLAARDGMPILEECSAREIAFVPFCPLGYPKTQREEILTNPVVNSVAAAHAATATQVALAWLLAIAPNVLLIPGTRTRAHLAENLAAEGLWLSDRDIALLNEAFS
ncbi:oxidoreductase [Mycolicibacterium moriokaense]|uniref:Aryl-alcohol dehydrogenase-like predicted oxidoreductase n=1 Tax=Mycolicibacterium moriokaense TaxID=39691 RepID=A0A318HA11_9MYCO|nr:oxidoreductase [Mycolicibacterium moriokaense]PXX03367.1 aryl-alcohol dehydrogenase-like predicted oxidoreductase [Mycolicibacterium moriokaense]